MLADHTFRPKAAAASPRIRIFIAGGTDLSSDEALIDNPTYFPSRMQREQIRAHRDRHEQNGKVYIHMTVPFPCLTYSTLRDLLDAKSVRARKFYATPVQELERLRARQYRRHVERLRRDQIGAI